MRSQNNLILPILLVVMAVVGLIAIGLPKKQRVEKYQAEMRMAVARYPELADYFKIREACIDELAAYHPRDVEPVCTIRMIGIANRRGHGAAVVKMAAEIEKRVEQGL